MGNFQFPSLRGSDGDDAGTPQTKQLPKDSDPRSPTEGISRTPIEVTCTPKSAARIRTAALYLNHKEKHSKFIERCESNSQELVETNVASNIDLTEDSQPKIVLDTVDNCDDSSRGISQNSTISGVHSIIDDRSMKGSLAESLRSEMDGLSINDPSMIVSDNEVFEADDKPIHDWLLTIEDRSSGFISEASLLENNAHSNQKQKCVVYNDENQCQLKGSSYATPKTKNPISDIKRTPLSALSQNNQKPIIDHTKSGLKMTKVWRNIEEERQRRGLSLGDENTPPSYVPIEKVSSAPGKLTRRRRILQSEQDAPTCN